MTSADPVATARQLLAAAHQLPWEPYFAGHGDPFVLGRSSHNNDRPGAFPFDVIAEVAKGTPDYGRANAELLGAAPGLLAALADEVERLRAAAPALVYLIEYRDAANETSTVMYVATTWDKAADWCRRNLAELEAEGDWFALLANRVDFDDDAEVSGVLTGRYDHNGLQDDRDVMAAKGYTV